MEYKSIWYRRAEYWCLVLALILQLVTLSAPGWRLKVLRNTEVYSGIFYQTECIKDKCKTESFHNIYQDTMSQTKYQNDTLYRIENEYHGMIKLEVYMIVILLTTLVLTILQYYKLKHKETHFPRITALSIPLIGISCGLMINIIIDEFLWIDYMLDVTDVDDRQNHYIGFPYCLATYIAALVVLVFATSLYVVEVTKLQQKTRMPPPRKVFEEDDYEPPNYEPPISVIPIRNDSMVHNGLDRNICDVRL